MIPLRCDFCYAEVPAGQDVRIYAKDFEQYVLPLKGGSLIHVRSNGDWCACPQCLHFLRDKDWDGLTERVVDVETRIYGMPENMVREFLKTSWERLRANLEVIQ